MRCAGFHPASGTSPLPFIGSTEKSGGKVSHAQTRYPRPRYFHIYQLYSRSRRNFHKQKLLRTSDTHCSQLLIIRLQYNTEYHILPDTSVTHVTNSCMILIKYQFCNRYLLICIVACSALNFNAIDRLSCGWPFAMHSFRFPSSRYKRLAAVGQC